MCFPVNFVKFLRTSFFVEHLQWLRLSRLEVSLQWVEKIEMLPF